MDLKDEIGKAAYEIFIKSGCIAGRDMDNWLEAERIVTEKYKSTVTTDAPAPEEAPKTEKVISKAKKSENKTPKKKAEPKKAVKQTTKKKEK